MRFKIGDKVKIHDCEGDPRYNGKIGVVIKTDRMHPRWKYLCSFDDVCDCLFGLAEMTKIVTKGQQLVFSFMK